MESEQPSKRQSPAEYAEMVKSKLQNNYANILNPMSDNVVDALNDLLTKSSVKLKNETLEQQFKTDLLSKQVKAFDDLWHKLELTEALTDLKRQMQTKPKTVRPESSPTSECQQRRIKALEARLATLEQIVGEQQETLQEIFGDVEQKRQYFDRIKKNREKLNGTMTLKATEIDEYSNGLIDRRSIPLTLMD